MFNSVYEKQAELMLRCLPEVTKLSCFALKGGTAINFFIQPMPRLSVDIDLTYIYKNDRDASLSEIDTALRLIASNLENGTSNLNVSVKESGGKALRIVVRSPEAQIKIEPNLILRGTVFSCENRDLSSIAQEKFGIFVVMHCLSNPDIYGGKLCAALDRQHPRDLFDVKLLLDDTGITSDIRRAFVVYLAGHNRPMNELLNPRFKDISDLYEDQFAGMTREEVSLEELQKVQHSLASELVQSLDNNERRFLVSLKEGDPEWNLLGIENLDQFPSIKWKLMNIQKMNSGKLKKELEKLKKVLDV